MLDKGGIALEASLTSPTDVNILLLVLLDLLVLDSHLHPDGLQLVAGVGDGAATTTTQSGGVGEATRQGLCHKVVFSYSRYRPVDKFA